MRPLMHPFHLRIALCLVIHWRSRGSSREAKSLSSKQARGSSRGSKQARGKEAYPQVGALTNVWGVQLRGVQSVLNLGWRSNRTALTSSSEIASEGSFGHRLARGTPFLGLDPTRENEREWGWPWKLTSPAGASFTQTWRRTRLRAAQLPLYDPLSHTSHTPSRTHAPPFHTRSHTHTHSAGAGAGAREARCLQNPTCQRLTHFVRHGSWPKRICRV